MAGTDFDTVVSKFFSPGQIKKIKAMHIGIAGAGGLGSNCATFLVRCGFEKFTLVDFDEIEHSNLNRQAYFTGQVGMPKVTALRENMRRINDLISVKTFQISLSDTNLDSVFSSCDIIIEAFDKSECKAMIARKFKNSDKLLVCASGLAGYGNSDRIETKKMGDTFYLIGDTTSEVAGDIHPYAPCVAIAAAKQADVVLEWVLGREEG
ncbi:MAG: sulfur carrier protein ThiS adenylyltransferase ThiF [Chitinivibrionales bacterium]|nr:sulfur carrier protein ThiS adenylyltransferase ThiF [Chitinivibrionales bacterium]